MRILARNASPSRTGSPPVERTLSRPHNQSLPKHKCAPSKEPPEERRRFIRDAHDLVRCLAIELVVELSFGSTVVPVGKRLED